MPVAEDWKLQGKCRDMKEENIDDIFFPEDGKKTSYNVARAYCKDCPVRMTCLTYAIVFGINWGAWGGLSPAERRTFARGRRREILNAWQNYYPLSLEQAS